MTGQVAIGIILAHLVGDYILQTDWMANEKTKRWFPAVLHGLVYTLPYVIITQSLLALAIISGTHMIIDRYRLAKRGIWAYNQLSPRAFRYSWKEASQNSGFPEGRPVWLTTWLMFIVDNTYHLLINFAVILYLS